MKAKILTWIITFPFAGSVAFAHGEGSVVDTARPALAACTQRPNNTGQDRVTNIFNRIYSASQSMYSQFDRSQFCVNLYEKEYLPGRNAYAGAISRTGEVAISRGFLLQSPSEEEIAATISHELSHILVNVNDPIPFEIRRRGNPELISQYQAVLASKSIIDDLRNNRQAFSTMLDAKIKNALAKSPNAELQARFDSNNSRLYSRPLTESNWNTHPAMVDNGAYEELRRIGNELGLSDPHFEEFNNKLKAEELRFSQLKADVSKIIGKNVDEKFINTASETEADEIGLELFARAGYDPSLYADILYRYIMLTTTGIQTKEQAVQHCQITAQLQNTASSSHLSYCDRVENINKELREHADFYNRLRMANSPIDNASAN